MIFFVHMTIFLQGLQHRLAEAEVEVEAEIRVGIELGVTASRQAGSSVKGMTPVVGNRDSGAIAVSTGVSTSGLDSA